MPGVKPVLVELTDFKTKQVVDTLEVDAVLVATGRAPFTQARACACMLWTRYLDLYGSKTCLDHMPACVGEGLPVTKAFNNKRCHRV